MVYGGAFHQGYGQFPVASLRSRSNVARKVAVPYLLSTMRTFLCETDRTACIMVRLSTWMQPIGIRPLLNSKSSPFNRIFMESSHALAKGTGVG